MNSLERVSTTNARKMNVWSPEEDSDLLRYAELNEFKNWKRVAEHIRGKTDIQCSARYRRIKPGIQKGAWSFEDDERVIELISKYGKDWSKVAKDFGSTRTGKQIRDRYLNSLDPTLKRDRFTAEEDKLIEEKVSEHGKCWSYISKCFFSGRTADNIKNRYYSKILRATNAYEELEGNVVGKELNFIGSKINRNSNSNKQDKKIKKTNLDYKSQIDNVETEKIILSNSEGFHPSQVITPRDFNYSTSTNLLNSYDTLNKSKYYCPYGSININSKPMSQTRSSGNMIISKGFVRSMEKQNNPICELIGKLEGYIGKEVTLENKEDYNIKRLSILTNLMQEILLEEKSLQE